MNNNKQTKPLQFTTTIHSEKTPKNTAPTSPPPPAIP